MSDNPVYSRILDRAKRSTRRASHGAALPEMGLLVGLVAIVALTAISTAGQEVRTAFCSSADRLSLVMGGDGVECDTEQAGGGIVDYGSFEDWLDPNDTGQPNPDVPFSEQAVDGSEGETYTDVTFGEGSVGRYNTFTHLDCGPHRTWNGRYRASMDDHAGANRHALIEVHDMLVDHPDAARRDRATDGLGHRRHSDRCRAILRHPLRHLIDHGGNHLYLDFWVAFCYLSKMQEADMAQSIKLSDEVMALVRREADLQSRSVAGQITHWLKIGRAIERSGTFDHARLGQALEGALDTTELSEEEEAAWLDDFTEKMGEASKEEIAFFARRRALGQGVGIDAGGNLIYAKDDAA